MLPGLLALSGLQRAQTTVVLPQLSLYKGSVQKTSTRWRELSLYHTPPAVEPWTLSIFSEMLH